jgi:catechol 2,3-dioxygenase-like lactoylglutathione lyase family enzyme
MTSLLSVALGSPDPEPTTAFYKSFLGPEAPVVVRHDDAPTSGFRGFTISLVVSQPGNADLLLEAAVAGGARIVKHAAKNLWGYGGVVQAPDGAMWKVACSAKKDKGPASRDVEQIALLLGCGDVKRTKEFYVAQGLAVDKSYGSKYVQFASGGAPITLGLYGRKALAKDAGVPVDGDGARRFAMLTDGATFTDPDGFEAEPA